jgi:nucleotide-binding universal stress UspA family protein
MTLVKESPVATSAAKAESAIRSLIVHVEATPQASPRLHTAVDLARQLDATLIGVGVEMLQTYSDPYGALGGEWVAELQNLVVDNLKRAEATFRAKSAGLKTEWISVEAFPGRVLAHLSRGADLIVAGGAPIGAEGAYRAADAAELAITSGRPVLVAPPHGGRFHGRGVVVAWKDTRESRRALTDSLPFLKAAEQVTVIEVCGKGELDEARAHTADVVKHLQRHGIEAVAKVVSASPDRVSTELNIAAQAIDADLIVAGAYGHTRLGEWMFGGVTYDLLNAPERFVLLSH